VLGFYAVLWQKVLEVYPLNKAFLCKSVTIIIILALSHYLFGETISLNNILGAILIILGIGMLSWKK
jgi:drug/metabolite transporter (DMT)-like permease